MLKLEFPALFCVTAEDKASNEVFCELLCAEELSFEVIGDVAVAAMETDVIDEIIVSFFVEVAIATEGCTVVHSTIMQEFVIESEPLHANEGKGSDEFRLRQNLVHVWLPTPQETLQDCDNTQPLQVPSKRKE